ncbi:dopamine receptor 2 [Megalops cyprinoides]|uniref:dopamine receptor 2 n=1 Tax=Megalops cyprinoides TaxID=118141 RepID=UPI00186420BC|nr:dopamine receptor 2 [Megalops cyprinoides]
MGLKIEIFTFRFVISLIGLVGNLILIVSILKIPHLKTFEIFLLGLAVSNLEGILIVDIYDFIIIIKSWTSSLSMWSCNTLRSLTVTGETATILFTMLISVFRYQKLRDVETRVNLPVAMDKVRTALAMSGSSMLLAVLFGMPVYAMNLDGHMLNYTRNDSCPPDFFQCPKNYCPVLNRAYKYLFLLICILLPLFVVTVTSCFIIRILRFRQRAVAPPPVRPTHHHGKKTSAFQRSTTAVLAAMIIFQLDWTVYLVLHLVLDPYSFSSWSETEFFITTTYSTISPYIYGMGNNLFSVKHF